MRVFAKDQARARPSCEVIPERVAAVGEEEPEEPTMRSAITDVDGAFALYLPPGGERLRSREVDLLDPGSIHRIFSFEDRGRRVTDRFEPTR